MPIKPTRQYRRMTTPFQIQTRNKRFDTSFYVEGAATTFNTPYVLYEYGGVEYKEMILNTALNEADFSDVIMQYDHQGMVFARTIMGQGKPATLIIEPQNDILFIAADLSLTTDAQRMYESIASGLVTKMSWAFQIAEETFDAETNTRIISKISKVFDVSGVSLPANDQTDISARGYFDGVIEKAKRESLQRRKNKLILQTKILGG